MRFLNMFLVLLLLLPACVGKGMKKVHRSTSVISEAEIEQSTATNAFEIVQQLRPHLLRRQANRQSIAMTPGAPSAVVYVDGVRYGYVESLQDISSFSIAEIEYISSREATFRYGSDHGAGAFLVKSK